MQRPLADEARERLALDIFPIHMSPGEYAGRYGDDAYGCFSYEGFSYRNDRLDRWIQAVARILRDPELLEECRARVREQ